MSTTLEGITLRRAATLAYLESMRVPNRPYGQYYFAKGMLEPVLYASTYVAMTRHLYRDLEDLTSADRTEWITYLQSHQDDDGLFRDPLISGEGWYKDDPLWCGRPHLTCHVVTALTCLGAVANKPLTWLDQFYPAGRINAWLAEREWADRPAWVGNEVMNVGTLLQYARDFQANRQAAETMQQLFDWLDKNWIFPATGMWGGLDANDPIGRSHLVQAAYHIWPLYVYDQRPIPYLEAALDTVLQTQNPLGSFGWGIHNPAHPSWGSACEDIDSIEPLVRFSQITQHRRDEDLSALRRAVSWVLSNQNSDGGFVFVRGAPFDYGHRLMQANVDESSMMPTWFRTLSLAYLGKAIPDTSAGHFDWQFCGCPGYQFWNQPQQQSGDGL